MNCQISSPKQNENSDVVLPDISNTLNNHGISCSENLTLQSEQKQCNKNKSEVTQLNKDVQNTVSPDSTLRKPKKKKVCPLCNKEFLSVNLQDHINTHYKYKRYLCHKCGKLFAQRANLGSHLHTSLLCETCGKQFKKKSCLELHVKKYHEMKELYECVHCKEQFTDYTRYKTHRKQHADERKHVCKLCGCTFLQSSHLKQHLENKHKTEIPFRCDLCGKGFIESYKLQMHKYSHEKPGYGFKICNICNNAVIEPNFKFHKHLHIQGSRFICRCNKTFCEEQQYKAHIRLNTCETNIQYFCDLCNTAFLAKQFYDSHCKIHTGDRPFKCTRCDKSFAQKVHLTHHIRWHDGDKPFHCSYCGKTFISSGNLNQHVKVHTEERSFVCHFCSNCFTSSMALKNHDCNLP